MRRSLKLFLCAGATVLAFYAGYVLTPAGAQQICQISAQCQNATCKGESNRGCTYSNINSGMLCVSTGLPGSSTCHSPNPNNFVICTGTGPGGPCSGTYYICDGPCP